MGDVAGYKARRLQEEEEEEGEGRKQDQSDKRRQDDKSELADLTLLVPNLELATGCSPAHLPGGPPSVLAQTLTQRLSTLLHTNDMIGLDPLRIWFRPDSAESAAAKTGATGMGGEGAETDAGAGSDGDGVAKAEVKAFWVLYIDVLFISLDGNAFDAAWLAVVAALRDTVLPRAWWDAERETVLCSDEGGEAGGLEIRDVLVPLSFGVFGGEGGEWVLVDTDGFEEGLCREGGTVVVGGEGRVVRVEKSGGAGVGVGEMRGLVEAAGRRREEWMGVLGVG